MEDNIKYVTCKICGKKGRILTNHLKKKHNISRRDYEEKYNSPAVCYERQLIQIERNKLLNNKLSSDPYYIELMKKVRKENGNNPKVQRALQDGHIRYVNSEEGRSRNSEIMKNNHKYNDIQRKATEGKLKSKLFHDVHSEFLRNQNIKRFSDEEYKKKHMKKLFDSSKKEYICNDGEIVKLRSSYEFSLYKYLKSKNIEFEYENIRITYECDSKTHEYIPDFYLPEYNLILEVKPHMYTTNKVNQIKKEACIQSGYKFLFVTERELKDLNSFFHDMIKGA